MRVIVDTNVAVVANGKSQQASPQCVATCAVRLNDIVKQGKLILDDKWLILKEYMQNLRPSGQPGAGDAFLKWVLTNYRNPTRCELIPITPMNEEHTNFAEFPGTPGLASFHSHDRKFVAVAAAHPEHPPILQAVDVEWWGPRDQFCEAGIMVDFLCPDDIRGISQAHD